MQSMWYRFWKFVASFGMKMYFSKIQVEGMDRMPKKGPVILAVNHQNSFLDAIIVACVLKRKSFFLARGDVFKKGWATKMLSSLGIMPIYRFRDGHGKVKDNEAIFAACSNILNNDGMVMIFPEGNHYMRWFLRPLQRGIARIAFLSQAKQESKPIKIVPIGLQYENHMKAASRILVNIGNTLDVKSYSDKGTEERIAMEDIISDLHKAMKQLILNIPEEGYDEYVKRLQMHQHKFLNVKEQLEWEQKYVDNLIMNPDFESDSVMKDQRSVMSYLIYPLIPLGWLSHILPRILISTIVNNTSKDPQFIAPMNFALGMVLYPLNALLWGAIIGVVFSSALIGVAGSIIVILMGKLTIKYWH